MTKYRLKSNLSKKKIMGIVADLVPGLEMPRPSKCVIAQYRRDYTLEFMNDGYYYKVALLVMFGELLLYVDRRTSLAERFVTVQKVKIPYDYLTTNGLIERM